MRKNNISALLISMLLAMSLIVTPFCAEIYALEGADGQPAVSETAGGETDIAEDPDNGTEDQGKADDGTDADAAGSPDESAQTGVDADADADAGDEVSGQEAGDESADEPETEEEIVIEDSYSGSCSVTESQEINENRLGDQDELLEGYIETEVSEETDSETGAGTLTRKTRMGNRLKGNDRVAYDTLREEIEKIASGDRADAMIEVTFTVDASQYKTDFTAEELGVERTTYYDDEGTLVMDSDAFRAMLRTFYNSGRIVDALLLDLPYDFYWFDKTLRYTITSRCAASNIIKDPDGRHIGLKDGATIKLTFKLPVSADYSVTGGTGTYDADTEKTGAASAAASRASEIILEYNDLGDFDKVIAYRNVVCGLTSYDYTASGRDYGDPWQLIYVFDGDPQTNVVCEGYAKAFQFLCDMSSFRSGEVSCITASGTITTEKQTGTQTAGHMWNIIRMDDGRNYIADVTNCDTGMVGAPTVSYPNGKLFLTAPLAGRVSTEYEFRCGSTTVKYDYRLYDNYGNVEEDLRDLFTDRELALSDVPYSEDGSGTENHIHEFCEWGFAGTVPLGGEGVKERECLICGEAEQEPVSVKVTGIKGKTYTGGSITQTPVLTCDGEQLRAGTDYKVSYSNNKNVGAARIMITGTGRFSGTISYVFNINPKGRSISKLTRAKKAFTVKWSSQTAKMSVSRIGGYQIQYSTSKNFSSGTKTVTVSGYKKTSRKIKSLKSKKVYYVRLRTYMKTGGKTYYSPWSAAKSVKTK